MRDSGKKYWPRQPQIITRGQTAIKAKMPKTDQATD